MTYLLDVNGLLALAFKKHVFHRRVSRWLAGAISEETATLTTCAIVELGFVRVASGVAIFESNVADAREALARLKRQSRIPFRFLADDHGADRLPGWVTTARQTTDGHLAELAAAHSAMLATLDEGIPGAFLIPQPPE